MRQRHQGIAERSPLHPLAEERAMAADLCESARTSAGPELEVVVVAASVLEGAHGVFVELSVFGEATAGTAQRMCEGEASIAFHMISCAFQETDVPGTVTAISKPSVLPRAPLLLRCRLPPAAAAELHRGARVDFQIVAPAWDSLTIGLCPRGDAHRHFRVAACSQPLFGVDRHQVLVGDWLEYHLAFGIEHIVVYDSDGSAAAAVAGYVANGSVTYFPMWASNTLRSPFVSNLTAHGAMYCAEASAEAHCLAHLRGRSSWLFILHSFDEFLSSDAGASGMEDFLRAYSQEGLRLPKADAAVLSLASLNFGGARTEGTSSLDPAVAQFHRHTPGGDAHFSVACVPERTQSLHVHSAMPRPTWPREVVDPRLLRVHHYIDLMGPRFASDAGCFSMRDVSATWAVPMLTAPMYMARREERAVSDFSHAGSSAAASAARAVLGAFYADQGWAPTGATWPVFREMFDTSMHRPSGMACKTFWSRQPFALRRLHAAGVRVEGDADEAQRLFDSADMDSDGVLSRAEFVDGLWRWSLARKVSDLFLATRHLTSLLRPNASLAMSSW